MSSTNEESPPTAFLTQEENLESGNGGGTTSLTRELSCAPVFLLLFVLILERSAFYSVTLNVHTFSFYSLGYEENTASLLSLFCAAWSKVLVLPFGYASDKKIDSYIILVIGFVFYVISLIIVWISTSLMHYFDTSGLLAASKSQILYLFALFLLSLGSAAVHAVLIPITLRAAEKTRLQSNLFIKFFTHVLYCSMNLGAVIASVIISASGSSQGFPYPVALLSVIVALMLVCLLRNCLCTRFLRDVDGYSEITGTSEEMEEANALSSQLERFPLILLCLLPYEIAQSQVISSFVVQSSRLSIYKNSSFWKIATHADKSISCKATLKNRARAVPPPPSYLNLANSVSVILFIVVACCILKRCGRRFPEVPTRVWWATLIAFTGLLAALGVEVGRRCETSVKFAYRCIQSGKKTYLHVVPYSNISSSVVFPQFVLIGLSESIGGPALLETFLSVADSQHWGMSFGLYNVIVGLGKMLGVVLISIMQSFTFYFTSWLTEDPISIEISSYTTSDIQTPCFYGILSSIVLLRLLFVSFFQP